MHELKLTDEQVEAAAKAMRGADLGLQDSAANYRNMLYAAAPFLHAPWEMPTDSEMSIFLEDAKRLTPSERIVHDWRKSLQEFIGRRNAALLPEPVDPRREKVIAALLDGTHGGNAIAEKLADRILAALESA